MNYMSKHNLILTEKQLNSLPSDTSCDLLHILYAIEDQLDYKCKKVSNTINYLQDHLQSVHK